MRLLHVDTYELHEFFGHDIPPYAILSHRWEEEEVTFRDIQDLQVARRRKGWSKIENFCHQVRHFGYVWIDTCCIDKSSSAEQSEAINSMYKWYRRAGVCYVYLSDVFYSGQDSSTTKAAIVESKWFTRCWTLQELIAPPVVWFFDCHWRHVADRAALSEEIESRIGISKRDIRNPWLASVAKRMSWAAGRKTTRQEDEAYCLLGLFDVNMPLLYGEGRKAFYRLQLEIIKQSDDESIFAWHGSEPRTLWMQTVSSGLLAESPDGFKRSRDVRRLPCIVRPPYEMTNKGLHIELLLKRLRDWSDSDSLPQWAAPLNCARQGSSAPLLIYLQQRQGGFFRVRGIEQASYPPGLGLADDLSMLQRRQVYVLQKPIFEHDLSEPRGGILPGVTSQEDPENTERRIRERIRRCLVQDKLL